MIPVTRPHHHFAICRCGLKQCNLTDASNASLLINTANFAVAHYSLEFETKTVEILCGTTPCRFTASANNKKYFTIPTSDRERTVFDCVAGANSESVERLSKLWTLVTTVRERAMRRD